MRGCFPASLKRVKTYLRSTMAQQRFNNLSIMSFERELSSALLEDVSPVVDKFVDMKNKRANLKSVFTRSRGDSRCP